MESSYEGQIQFFQSSSSYSPSLASSKFITMTEQIFNQYNLIILTLKTQLPKYQTLNTKQKLKFIMNRATILVHYTIPEQIDSNRKKINDEDYNKLKTCQTDTKSILQNYQSLLSDQISYEQFYRLYVDFSQSSSVRQNNFPPFLSNSSKVYNLSEYKVEQIQIVLPVPFMYKSSTNFNRNQNESKHRSQNKWLIQQISQLKQSLSHMKMKHKCQLQTIKCNYQKRLKNIIQVKCNQLNIQYKNSLLQELKITKTALINQMEDKQSIFFKNSTILLQINTIQKQNKSLKEQIDKFRYIQDSRLKLQLEQSRQLSSNVGKLSSNQGQQSEKKLKNDQSLVKLLKYQVKNQRLKSQNIKMEYKGKLTGEYKKQKNIIQANNKKIYELQIQNDLLKQKYQSLLTQKEKLQQKIGNLIKQISFLKENLNNKTNQNMDNSLVYLHKNQIQKSSILKQKPVIQIDQYEGDGLQGFIYYQCLQKQFRYRYKRACLKQKQLLYKKNGLQIGVITKTFTKQLSQCRIDLTIFCTNYSDLTIKNVHVKVMNYSRIINSQIIQSLKSGNQKKFAVQLSIQSYPIGPVVLCLHGDNTEQIRILLPVNIFKMFKFEQNTQKYLIKPKLIVINFQKRIIKNIECLKELLFLKSNSQQLNIIGFHEHSSTKLLMNIKLQKQLIKLNYQHLVGSQKIVQYFIKCFCFLIKKNH